MDDLENITSRLAIIASERAALDSEESELLVAQRVLRRLRGRPVSLSDTGSSAAAASKSAFIRAVIERSQQGRARSILPVDGSPMTRAAFRSEMEKLKGESMSDNAFITMLSRLAADEVIIREGDTVRRHMGGADVS